MTIGLQEFRRLTGDESAPPSVKLLSVEKWGAKATASPAANTAGITNAIKWLRGGDDRALLFPDYRYKLAGAIAVGETAADVISGLRMYGQSRGGTVLEQTTDGVPIWQLNGATIHSCVWEHFTFTHTNMQAVAAASVFSHIGSAGAAMHNCTFRDIAASNFYYFTYAPNAAVWGNAYEDLYLGDFAGGVNKISGAAGKPNNKLDRIYINAPSATLPLFDHQGVIAQYDNIEVANAGAGATMLADAGGGYHVIGHWAFDAGYYANNATLFNMTNGTLLADFVYTENLKVAATKTLTLYACGGTNSFIDVRYHAIKALDAANAGTVIAVAGTGPRKARFREIIMPWSASVLLTDASTTAADFVTVDSWSDPGNVAFNGNASVTLTHSSPMCQVFTAALTAARDCTLPDARALKGTQLFNGRPFRVVRSNAGGAFPLTVKDAQGATVATIPASTAGTLDVVWQRGTGWIVEPAASPVVASDDTPLANGTAAPGTSAKYARADHVHPSSGGTGGGTVKSAALNNFKKSNTRVLQAIMARGATPVPKGRGRIVIIGDSYLAGYAAGNGDNMDNGRKNCATTQLVNMLAARGFNIKADWTVGSSFTDDIAALTRYDGRLSFTGCSLLTGFNAVGGNIIQLGTSTDRMNWIPGGTFDTAEILVACNNKAGVSGNFDVLLNGTLHSTQTSNDILGVKRITLTGLTAGTNQISVRGKTNSTFICGIGTRNAAANGIEVVNCAATGQKVAILAAPKNAVEPTGGDVNTWNNIVTTGVLMDTNALNCTIINGWFNDNGGYTLAATQANLDSLIKFYKTKGDVMFIGYGPLRTVAMDLTTYNTWQNAMYATCVANDIPYIDPPADMVDGETAYTWGLFGDGGWHYGSDGQAIIARLMLAGIESVT